MIMPLRWPLLLLPILLISGPLLAQKVEIKHLGAAEGLSQGMVTALCQDSDGFLWVGTLDGLNRFDGKHFKTFKHDANDPYSPSGNLVQGIFEDRQGRMWVGFDEYLDCYDRKTGCFYHLGNQYNTTGEKLSKALPLFQTADGQIWLYDLFCVRVMTVPDDFPARPERAADIRYDIYPAGNPLELSPILNYLPDGGVVIDYLNGRFQRFDATTRTFRDVLPVATTPFDQNNNVHEMLFDPKRKGHWLRLKRDFYLIKDGAVRAQYKLPEIFDQPEDQVIARPLAKVAVCDKDGHIWLLHDGNLYLISPPNREGEVISVKIILDKKTEKHPFYKLLLAQNGTLFVGSSGYGLLQINLVKQHFEHRFEGRSVREISALDSDKMFINVGRNRIADSKGGSRLLPVEGFRAQDYNHTIQTADGRIIALQGVVNEHKIRISSPHSQPYFIDLLFNLPDQGNPFCDYQGRVWVASHSGELASLPKGSNTLQLHDLRPLWKNGEVNCIPKQLYQSKNGVLWMANAQGLIEIHAREGSTPSFKLWQKDPQNPQSLSSNNLLSVLDDPLDPDRYLWVTTNGNGISKMDKQTGLCRHFTQKDGLPNNVVYGILNDTQGRLWISTNYGLSCYNPSTGHFLNFTLEDGLQDNEFNTYAFCKFPDGKMAFGGINGLTTFYPDEIIPNATFPKVFIHELKINDRLIGLRDSSGLLQRPLEFTQEIRLRYDQNYISAAFAVLDFSHKKESPLYYKMEGVDRGWVFTNSLSELNYPNLAPGTYTLQIASVNENGERNSEMTTLKLVISPPWWRSWWAYLVYLLLAAWSAWWFYRLQINRIKERDELMYREKEAQNLKVLDELKTRFFTNVTHEFRTPLTLIIEPARQIAQYLPENAFAQTQSRIILNNANRLLALVNQLLDLSKIEDGSIRVNWSQFDLLPLLREVTLWFQPVLEKKGQMLFYNCDLDTLDGVSDPAMLEKIMYNLLSNAHKFTPAGGRIDINITKTDTEHWCLRVCDTGIGIAPNELPHIFDRFYQVDNSLTRHREGTGIGLALVRELCTLLDGTISVESRAGTGTVFELTFPIRPVAKNSERFQAGLEEVGMLPMLKKSLSTLSLPTEDKTILLVEDNDELREYLKLILSQQGYAILEAENGKVGLEKALECVPELIISDVMMPEMDGYELTERLKNDAITSHIPIVILTAKGRQESKIEGYRRGADAYLPKPFDTGELLVRLQGLLENRLKIQQKYQQRTALEAAADPLENAPNFSITTGISDLDAEWLVELENIIREKMGQDDFNVDTLQALCLMNRTQFFAKVKALTGLTPATLVRNTRLDAAQRLLKTQPELTVREVMFKIGLNDVKSFTAAFKERFGTTPKQIVGAG